MTEPKCLIFVPTYNEAGNVEVLYNRIARLDLNADLLFMDDNSPDGTGAILDRLAAEHPELQVVHRPEKRGIGSAHAEAISRGYEKGYANLITMDSDLTQPPEAIPALLEALPGCDLVIGSRHLEGDSLPGWSPLRRFLTKFAHLCSRLLLGMPFDATSSFRLYRLDRIPAGLFSKVTSPGYSFFMESLFVLWSNGVQVHEIPVQLPARQEGSSKMRAADAWKSLKTLLRLSLRRLL